MMRNNVQNFFFMAPRYFVSIFTSVLMPQRKPCGLFIQFNRHLINDIAADGLGNARNVNNFSGELLIERFNINLGLCCPTFTSGTSFSLKSVVSI